MLGAAVLWLANQQPYRSVQKKSWWWGGKLVVVDFSVKLLALVALIE